jgi:hypothetical protein
MLAICPLAMLKEADRIIAKNAVKKYRVFIITPLSRERDSHVLAFLSW